MTYTWFNFILHNKPVIWMWKSLWNIPLKSNNNWSGDSMSGMDNKFRHPRFLRLISHQKQNRLTLPVMDSWSYLTQKFAHIRNQYRSENQYFGGNVCWNMITRFDETTRLLLYASHTHTHTFLGWPQYNDISWGKFEKFHARVTDGDEGNARGVLGLLRVEDSPTSARRCGVIIKFMLILRLSSNYIKIYNITWIRLA